MCEVTAGAPGETTVEEPGEEPGETTGKEPGEEPGETTGKEPGEEPVETTGKVKLEKNPFLFLRKRALFLRAADEIAQGTELGAMLRRGQS